MTDMYDSVDPSAIPGTAGAVLIAADGRYEWSDTDRARFRGKPSLDYSVLADPAHECFDVERGDAPLGTVIQAVAWRHGNGEPSVLYGSISTCGQFAAALAAKSLQLSDASSWPAPGVYLFPAAPDPASQALVAQLPVRPVAVQVEWTADWDRSTCYGSFPSVEPVNPPAPPAPQTKEMIDMLAFDPQTGGYWALDPRDGHIECYRGAPYLGGLNNHPQWHALQIGPIAGFTAFRDEHGWGYVIAVELARPNPNGTWFDEYAFPRGSAPDSPTHGGPPYAV